LQLGNNNYRQVLYWVTEHEIKYLAFTCIHYIVDVYEITTLDDIVYNSTAKFQ